MKYTPDSSRYWIQESYEARVTSGQEPENVDKEVLRRWYASQCNPYEDEILPVAPTELVNELSRRYIMIYETLLDTVFDFSRVPEESLLAAAVAHEVASLIV